MSKKKKAAGVPTGPLPSVIPVEEIQRRLGEIFPPIFPDRAILTGNMSARVIFVFLYGGLVEGTGRFLRPSHVYFFTAEQSEKTSDEERQQWLAVASKPGYRPEGKRWYTGDNSRESIRDDLMRNNLLRLGIMHKKAGYPVTSSSPINSLDREFALLFDPELKDDAFLKIAEAWREKHLDPGTLQRMALRAQGIHAKEGDVFIDLPDGTRMRISAGPSADITKALVEDFAKRHLREPAVLWISASDKKSYSQFVELAAAVGLTFDPSKELPDLILADLVDPVSFVFCEVVASDGPVTEARKEALLELVKVSNIPEGSVKFLTAYEDRESTLFRKNFSQLAVDTLVWFRTEPHLLLILSTSSNLEAETIG